MKKSKKTQSIDAKLGRFIRSAKADTRAMKGLPARARYQLASQARRIQRLEALQGAMRNYCNFHGIDYTALLQVALIYFPRET